LPHPALGEDSRNRRSHLHVTPSATSGNNLGVVRLIANLPFRRRFVCPPSTETPFLHRNYPASSVLRASPPSPSARPVSRELPVDLYRDHRWDFPCCVWSTLPACRRQYPGRSDGTCSLVRFHSLRPSPKSGRVGSCVSLFEACSAFTHVTACMLTESPMRPSTPKASAASLPPPLLRLLPGGANQFPGGFTSRYGPPPFTAHPISPLTKPLELFVIWLRRNPREPQRTIEANAAGEIPKRLEHQNKIEIADSGCTDQSATTSTSPASETRLEC